jgi:hypothetical protein
MKIEIQLSEEHYRHFLALLAGGAFDGKIKQSHYGDFAPTILFGTFILLIMSALLVPREVIPVDLLSVAMGVLLGWLILYLITKFNIKQSRQKFFPEDDDPAFCPTSYTIEDDRIAWKTKDGQGFTSSTTLKKYFEDDSLILLFQSNQRAFIFPKNQIPEETIKSLRYWASNKIDSNK